MGQVLEGGGDSWEGEVSQSFNLEEQPWKQQPLDDEFQLMIFFAFLPRIGSKRLEFSVSFIILFSMANHFHYNYEYRKPRADNRT